VKETDAQPATRQGDKINLTRAKGETQAAGVTGYPKIVRSCNRERGKLVLGDLPFPPLIPGTTGEKALAWKETCWTSQL